MLLLTDMVHPINARGATESGGVNDPQIEPLATRRVRTMGSMVICDYFSEHRQGKADARAPFAEDTTPPTLEEATMSGCYHRGTGGNAHRVGTSTRRTILINS